MKTEFRRKILLCLLLATATVANAAVLFRPIGSSFNTAEVRYIRDHLSGNSVNNSSHWVEIQAFNNSGTNLALNKNVKMFKADGTEFSPANLERITDGKIVASEYVTTGSNTNAYVVVDLGAIYSISYLKIFHYWNVNVPRTYFGTKTEISTDGVNWTTVFDSKSSNGNFNNIMYRESANGRTIYLADKISRNDNITLQTTGEMITFPQATEQVVIAGTTRTLTNFYREGFIFAGWNTRADGFGTHIAAGTNALATQTVYYAEWQPAPCTVQLNLNAGSGTENIRYIRDFQNKNTTNNSSHLVEIQAFNNSNTNVALNKSVRVFTAEGTEFLPANLARITDGVVQKTEYVSVGEKSNMFVEIDLGNVQQVSYLKIFHYWETPNQRAYFGTKTQVSADGVNWTTVFDSQSRYGVVGGKMYNETPDGHTIYLGNKLATTGNFSVAVAQGERKIFEPYTDFNGTKLPLFTREGHTLRSWNTRADGSGKSYPTTFEVSAKNFGSGTTLYAQWSPNQLTIDPNGGTYENVNNIRTIDVSTSGMALKLPHHATKIFKCWTGNAEKFISNYQNIPFATNTEQTISGSVSYAIENGRDYAFSDQFTINFWAYKASWANAATRFRVNYDVAKNGFDLVLNTETTNVRFEYFGSEKRIFTTNKPSNTLSAGWHQFTFTFDGKILRGFIDAQEVCNSTRSTTTTSANAHGTMFDGKLKNVCLLHHAMSESEIERQYKNPTTAYYFGTIANGNLQATWQDGYSVVFNFNGGTGEMPPLNCLVGQTYTLSTNAFTRKNHVFTGWNTQPDGSGTAFSDQSQINNLASAGSTITLYAQWRYEAIELSVNPNGGSYKNSTNVTNEPIGSEPFVVEKPSHASKSFSGWSGASEKFLSNCQNFKTSSWLETVIDTADAVILSPYNVNYHYNRFTANVWVYNADWTTFSASINDKNCSLISCMQSGGWKIYASNNGEYIGFQCATKSAAQSVTINGSTSGAKTWASLAAGWHMLTLVYDGTYMSGYLDGEPYCSPQKISGDIAPAADATVLVVGGDPNGTGGLEANGYFRGKMKNVCVMNHAMTAADVKRQFQNPNTTYYFSQNANGSILANWITPNALKIVPNGGKYRNSTATTITEIISNQPHVVAVPTKSDSTFLGWSGSGEKFLSKNQSFSTSSSKEVTFSGANAVKLKPYNANYGYKQFTANVWVYNENWANFTSAIGNSNCTLIGCMQSGGWKIYASNNGKYIGFQVATAGAATSATINSATEGAKTWASLSAGWHMLTLVYNGKQIMAYIDGNPYCQPISITGDLVSNYAAAILAIGGDANSTGGIEANSYFIGKMKNVGVINYAMTPEQVHLQYNNHDETFYFYQSNNLTLNALWGKDGYSVVYDANGGTGAEDNQICFANQTYKTKENAFERAGYTFANWNTSANGNGTNLAVGQDFNNLGTAGSQVKLYAQWAPINYKITYDYNDGSTSQMVDYSAASNLVLLTPVRGNFTFQNWVVTSANSGSWQLGSAFFGNQTLGTGHFGDVQLTAMWQRIQTPAEGKIGDETGFFAVQNGSQLHVFGTKENALVELFDLSGRCLLSEKMRGNRLNINEISSGIYVCKVAEKSIKVVITNYLR